MFFYNNKYVTIKNSSKEIIDNFIEDCGDLIDLYRYDVSKGYQNGNNDYFISVGNKYSEDHLKGRSFIIEIKDKESIKVDRYYFDVYKFDNYDDCVSFVKEKDKYNYIFFNELRIIDSNIYLVCKFIDILSGIDILGIDNKYKIRRLKLSKILDKN